MKKARTFIKKAAELKYDLVAATKEIYHAITSITKDSGISLSNCTYGRIGCSPGVNKDIKSTDLGGNRTIAAGDLKMAGDKAAQLGVDKYSLLLNSPVLGMGDASLFTATDQDLAGNLRLRDGRLDPGCFQCWLNILGTYLIMR